MKRIASFSVNHDKITRGMYISRIDGDVVTYDIRMKLPNNPEGDYLSNGAMHTIEHLFATYARNTKYSDSIVYVGPMGCRTGFYFLVRDNINHETALRIVQEAFDFIRNFDGEIPGSKKEECGNYKQHDLIGAKKEAHEVVEFLKDWTEEKMTYVQ
ncbi:MAG: S-ribosylhomocysteine lyase [bacterium]|nr:S-ribosylhomocysteine lyase [bacterium]